MSWSAKGSGGSPLMDIAPTVTRRPHLYKNRKGRMTTSTIICAKTEPLCYYRCCRRKATLQCDYRIDHWGNTCDAGMCEGHSAFLGYGRIRCDNHEPPENQGRMAL